MSKSYDNLREDFIFNGDQKEYRCAYGEESTDISIGTQIKVLREQREWRQQDLAREAGIQQPMVSRYENVNYSNWSITTLKKLARAYDVWLDVRFRSFGDLVNETNRFSRESLQVTQFSQDPFFRVKRTVCRPKIRATVWVQNPAQVIPFEPLQAIKVRNLVRPAEPVPQLRFQWDLPTGSRPGPQLVNDVPQQQQESASIRALSTKMAAAGGGGNYGN